MIAQIKIVENSQSLNLKYFTVNLVLFNEHHRDDFDEYYGDKIDKIKIRPHSSSKPQPDCIPAPLREDYYEACAIRDLSPKASATLARRCLQGMIRDFCGISRGRLIDEIKALRKALDEGNASSGVTDEGVDAIDHVRSVGNIGAHMEGDIDLIVDVYPGEAQALIELLEMLFDKWYVARQKRQDRLARVAAVAAEKAAAIAAGKQNQQSDARST